MMYQNGFSFTVLNHWDVQVMKQDINFKYKSFYISGFNGSELDSDYYPETLYPSNLELTPPESFVKYLTLIVFPYFLLLGTIGNLIGMALLRRYSHNVWSTCMYISLIFPMDLIKLYVECGNDWLTEVCVKTNFNLSREILLMSNAVCKVYTFIYNLLLSETEWLTVAVAIETAIAFKKPNWTYTMCTRERANAIILFISVLLISLNLHFFWTYGLVKPGDDPTIDYFLCTYINELSNQFRDSIWPTIQLCIEDAIPSAIIILCVIFCALSVLSKQESGQDKFLEKYFLDVKSLRELKRATLIMCIFTAISIISNMVAQRMRTGTISLDYTPMLLIITFTTILSYIIMSHKFMIFYICCEKFRYDVKHIVISICKPFRRKYRKSYARTGSLCEKTQDVAATSWQETEMMEAALNSLNEWLHVHL